LKGHILGGHYFTNTKKVRNYLNEIKLKTCNGFDVDTRCKEILTDVLKLHPEYLTKSGIIESFTVDNHEVYTDTRCFFINKADGTKVDFSVNKCLTNLAESQAHLDVSP
jgi:hypothetical protein